MEPLLSRFNTDDAVRVIGTGTAASPFKLDGKPTAAIAVAGFRIGDARALPAGATTADLAQQQTMLVMEPSVAAQMVATIERAAQQAGWSDELVDQLAVARTRLVRAAFAAMGAMTPDNATGAGPLDAVGIGQVSDTGPVDHEGCAHAVTSDGVLSPAASRIISIGVEPVPATDDTGRILVSFYGQHWPLLWSPDAINLPAGIHAGRDKGLPLPPMLLNAHLCASVVAQILELAVAAEWGPGWLADVDQERVRVRPVLSVLAQAIRDAEESGESDTATDG